MLSQSVREALTELLRRGSIQGFEVDEEKRVVRIMVKKSLNEHIKLCRKVEEEGYKVNTILLSKEIRIL